MPESEEHTQLVRTIQHWISENYSAGRWALCTVCDLPESYEKPHLIGGYRPDVWARDIPHSLTIVGEAKTAGDLENTHAEAQFRAYMNYLASQPRPILIVATSWVARAAAVLTVERLVRRLNLRDLERVFLAAGAVLRMPR